MRKPTTQKIKTINPKISNCFCGGAAEYNIELTTETSCSASVGCQSCGLTITEKSHDINSRKLLHRVVTKWNHAIEVGTKAILKKNDFIESSAKNAIKKAEDRALW